MEVDISLVGGYPCCFGRWFVAPPNKLRLTFKFYFSLEEQLEVFIFVI
jgi:hypothetical protein